MATLRCVRSEMESVNVAPSTSCPLHTPTGSSVNEQQSKIGVTDMGERMHVVRVVSIGFAFGFVVGYMIGGLLGALLGVAVMIPVSLLVKHVVVDIPARALTGILLPDMRGREGVGYSHIEALEAKGDFAGALAAWEDAIAASPDALAARINAADLYSRAVKNHVRAAELFRSVQAHPRSPDETKRYVSQRLIDLYLGPLADEGRALVELSKIAKYWPGTPEGEGARRAIAQIKGL
jgi:hypothetical protein